MPELESTYYPDYLYTDDYHNFEITKETFGPMYDAFYEQRGNFFFEFSKSANNPATNTYEGTWSLGIISGTLVCMKQQNSSTWRGTMLVTGKHYEGDHEGTPPLNWTASLIVSKHPSYLTPEQVEIAWTFNNGPVKDVQCKKIWTVNTQVKAKATCTCSVC